MMEHCYNLQRKRQKTVVDYTNHSLDDFQLIVVSASPYLSSREKEVLSTSSMRSSQDQSVKIIYKIILTNILNYWDGGKTNLHPISIAMTRYEHISPRIFSFDLKLISPLRTFFHVINYYLTCNWIICISSSFYIYFKNKYNCLFKSCIPVDILNKHWPQKNISKIVSSFLILSFYQEKNWCILLTMQVHMKNPSSTCTTVSNDVNRLGA